MKLLGFAGRSVGQGPDVTAEELKFTLQLSESLWYRVMLIGKCVLYLVN
jgi:hypothetical protein